MNIIRFLVQRKLVANGIEAVMRVHMGNVEVSGVEIHNTMHELTDGDAVQVGSEPVAIYVEGGVDL